MNSLVIDDLVFRPFVPVVDFAANPFPLFFESIEPVADDIVVTNIGNVAVSFFVTLDPVGAFELLGTPCSEGLAPGDSCVLRVRFDPSDAGEYTTEVVLRGADGGPIFAIPILGIQPLLEVTPTTLADAPTTAAPTTAVQTPVAPTAAPFDPSPSDGGGDSFATLIVVLLVALGGSVLLIRRWRGKPPKAAPPSDGALPPPTPTVTVTPDVGSNEITTDDRQPVTAIRVAVDPDRTTTTLTEEKPL
jgi:hypothetical protein